MNRALAIAAITCIAFRASGQADCAQTSVGLVPIMDMGSSSYDGYDGGLYGGGSNAMPQAHADAGLALALAVEPMDATGAPDAVSGRIGWLSIGMSNTQQETAAFIALANGHPAVNPDITFVNGGVGGQTAQVISAPWHPNYQNYWTTVGSRLQQAGITAQQVQVIWLKQANQANGQPLQTYRDSLYVQTKRIAHEMRSRFPNARLCYVASRVYGGYAVGALNPEPYAYDQGFIMRQVILEQINGSPDLAFDGPNGVSPWLAWGTYLWADGAVPRSDGLTWECPDDFEQDGVHPSAVGEQKVAALLFDFFSNEATACPWFLINCTTDSQDLRLNSIRCFPNPAMDKVVIDGFDGPWGYIIVQDGAGRALWTGSMNQAPATIDLSGLAAGLYVIRVLDRNGRRVASSRLTRATR